MNLAADNRRILIVGGGVSGASLAIRLAKRGFDVTVVERDKFPRHKLCGEFVSPECFRHFEDLDVSETMNAIGGDSIYETRFYSGNGKSLGVPSEWFINGKKGALGISRSEMDLRMLNKAREMGANVFEESRCFKIGIEKDQIKSIFVKDGKGAEREIFADMVIDATGRARVLSKLAGRQRNIKPRRSKEKYVGFKTHFENIRMNHGVCEIYFFEGGYGGLSFVEKGIANHCFIVKAKIAKEYRGDADEILKRVILKNSRARTTIGNARKKFDWLAVSVESFGKQPAPDLENLINVGDAAAFIDPFTGSGMLMALESSELLGKAIIENYASRFAGSAKLVRSIYEKNHAKAIKTRLRICALIHRFSFSPKLAAFVISAGNISGAALRSVAGMTRPHEDTR